MSAFNNDVIAHVQLAWNLFLFVLMTSSLGVGLMAYTGGVENCNLDSECVTCRRRLRDKCTVVIYLVGTAFVTQHMAVLFLAPWGLLRHAMTSFDDVDTAWQVNVSNRFLAYLLAVVYGIFCHLCNSILNKLYVTSQPPRLARDQTDHVVSPASEPRPRSPVQGAPPYWLINDSYWDIPYDVIRRSVVRPPSAPIAVGYVSGSILSFSVHNESNIATNHDDFQHGDGMDGLVTDLTNSSHQMSSDYAILSMFTAGGALDTEFGPIPGLATVDTGND